MDVFLMTNEIVKSRLRRRNLEMLCKLVVKKANEHVITFLCLLLLASWEA